MAYWQVVAATAFMKELVEACWLFGAGRRWINSAQYQLIAAPGLNIVAVHHTLLLKKSIIQMPCPAVTLGQATAVYKAWKIQVHGGMLMIQRQPKHCRIS